MHRLIEMGFIKVGYWTIADSKIIFVLSSHREEKDVLYAYVSNCQIYYIGKTTQSLEQRLKGYQRPGPAQKTNIRVNKKILYLLKRGLPIDIYILPDPGLLKYRGYKISLAGGLEDTLIHEFKPEWNITGRKIISSSIGHQKQRVTVQRVPQHIASNSFVVILYPTYYYQGFFNVGRKYSDLFGRDKDMIQIQLGDEPRLTIYGNIDRHANTNGTPRIRGRKPLRDWIQSNFHQGDVVVVEIIEPTSILLKTVDKE